MIRLALCWLLAQAAIAQTTPRVLLVTGGHDHEPSFYSVFAESKSFTTNVNPHPGGYSGPLDRYDVLVLYDIVQDATAAEKERLQSFVDSGKGLVVLHHAIVSFNNWPWYRETIGGQYWEKKSTFLHDVSMEIAPATDHPILKGISKFRLLDETYKGMWISEKNTVLLRTAEPTSDGPVAWVSPHPKAKIVVIQLGHGPEAHRDQNWRNLVTNAILWSAGKLETSK